jgi:hypothetical protein
MGRVKEEINIIMNKNWNRISEIMKKTHRTELLYIEQEFRIRVHNKMGSNLSKEDQEEELDSLLDFNERVKKSGVKSKWL